MRTEICLIATDAISFNVLYKGQLEFLRDNGLGLILICGGSQSELDRLRARKVGRVIDFGLVRQPSSIRDLLCLFRLILHLVANRYDLVLSTTPKAILLGSIASWVACQRNRVVFFQGRVYENFSGNKRRFYALLDRVAIRLSNVALFVSPSLLGSYESEGALAKRSGAVVGPGTIGGVDTECFSAMRFSPADCQQVREALDIPDAHSIVLTVGRICLDKGLRELEGLSTTFADKNVTFVIVGPVEEGDRGLATKVFAQANVRHVPFSNDVARYFAIADIHLFLTHREGFGNVALEAASCGLPTIGFDVVGVRDSIAHGVSGVRVSFGDIEKVAELIGENIVRRGEFRASFPEARAWAVANFSHELVWRAHLNFMRSLQGQSEKKIDAMKRGLDERN